MRAALTQPSRQPDQQAERDADDGRGAELHGQVGGRVLGDRGGRGERDVDPAGHQHDEEAHREDRGDRVALDQVDRVRRRQEVGRGHGQDRPSAEDHERQPGLGPAVEGGAQRVRHRSRSSSSCSVDPARDRRLDDPPGPHVEDAVAGGEDLGDLVGDQQDGDAAVRQLADDLVDALLVPDVDAERSGSRGSAPWARWRATWRARRAAGCRPRASAPTGPGPGCVIASRADPVARASLRRRAGSIRPDRPARRSSDGQHEVVLDRLPHVEAEAEPVLGDVGDAGADRVLVRAAARAAVPRAGSRRASGRVMPKSDSASSVRPAPSRPVRPSTSPRAQREGDVRRTRPSRVRPSHLEQRGGVAQVAGHDPVLDLEAGHQFRRSVAGRPRPTG